MNTAEVEKLLQRFLRERLADSEALATLDLLTLAYPEFPQLDETQSADFSDRLYTFLQNHALGKLQHHRQRLERQMTIHPLGATRSEAHELLRSDMIPRDSSDLEMWSALCFRFFSEWQPIEEFILSARVGIAKRTFEKKVEAGLHELAAELRRRERRTRQQAFKTDEISVPDRQFQGSRLLQQQVLQTISDPDGARVIALVGIGGIGKTTQAVAIGEKIREEHGQWKALLWISARQERLIDTGALKAIENAAYTLNDILQQLCIELSLTGWGNLEQQQRILRIGDVFRNHRYFVVFDNLETLEGAELLIKTILSDWKGESRFMVTSREIPEAIPGVQVERVAELSEPDSKILIETTAATLSRPIRLQREDMSEIYRRVGGIPLALKLLTAQFIVLPFDQVLQELSRDVAERRADETWAANLFSYLYQRTWNLLDAPGRQFLLGLSEVKPSGASYEWVMAMARGRGLSDISCREAMHTLRRHSLLEVNNSLREPRYRLHQLTITFLHTIRGSTA